MTSQPGILAPVPAHARYLWFSARPGKEHLISLERLRAAADGNDVVVGIGHSLVAALGRTLPGLRDFPQHSGPGVEVPSTPAALWCWLRGDDPATPWLMKTPQHMVDLPALLEVFPDARILFIHRDPAAVVGSSCSMVWNQMSVQSESADPHWIGREWLRKTRLKIDRMRTARSDLPAGRRLDVQYEAMERDWRGEMGRVAIAQIAHRLDPDMAQ